MQGRGLLRYAWTAFYVVLSTMAAWSARGILALPDFVALYLLVIMLVAARFGRGPSVLAATLSVVAYDVFFIEPLYTFNVRDQRNLLTFGIMFAVGLTISHLVLRIRQREEEVRRVELRARTEEMRSSLLSAVSHDLRTPLAAITGAATALRDEEAIDGAARRELIDTVCDEAVRLERLVVNLLDMTRLQASEVELKRQWVPLEEVVGAVLQRVEVQIGDRAVSTTLPEALPLVPVDAVLLEHALLNLVENALKHAPGPIELVARSIDGGVELDVADRGPGLPAAHERLFDKFVRDAKPGVEGAGLGLAIARGIARAHGGELTARNRDGGGAVFTLRLPIVGGPPEAQS